MPESGLALLPTVSRLPTSTYAEGVAAGRWRDDPAQRSVLQQLDRIHRELLLGQSGTVLQRLGRLLRAPEPVRGLYLWGGVGRGKTFLVDLLFAHLPIPDKRRVHFHRFMIEVHAALRQLKRQPDPLAAVADSQILRQRLLVLDEFFVSDIGDAMILARLFEALFARGLTLVTSSNTRPELLYPDGLQRLRFVPAIELIQRQCEVVQLISGTDYRLRQLTRDPVYHQPLGEQAEAALQACFARLSVDCPAITGPLEINGRTLTPRALVDGIAWFDFQALCEGPRAVADYIELARGCHTVLISGVPIFAGGNDDAARRFVQLVDEFYDRNVNLIVSAADLPERLYRGYLLRLEFERAASRLQEMQSRDYLAQPHRP